MNARTQLDQGLAQLGFDLPPEARERLLTYAQLIQKWNKVYNLTAVRDEAGVIALHLLDSLSVLPYLEGQTLADIGSGAGLPGLVLAIARPDLAVTLIESNSKKSSFQQQVRIELKLNNVQCLCRRVEEVKPEKPFDIVISRAFADMADFVNWSGHLVAPGGCLAAMKGVMPSDEIARLPQGYAAMQTIALNVPGVDAARHLVLVRRDN